MKRYFIRYVDKEQFEKLRKKYPKLKVHESKKYKKLKLSLCEERRCRKK